MLRQGASDRIQTRAHFEVWNSDRAAAVATGILVEYLGVSAQFVVEDAIAMGSHANGNGSNDFDELQLRSFLINLSGLLPPGLPSDRIRESILARYRDD